jgi:hypothetical protein
MTYVKGRWEVRCVQQVAGNRLLPDLAEVKPTLTEDVAKVEGDICA